MTLHIKVDKSEPSLALTPPNLSLHLRRVSFLHFRQFLFTSVTPTFLPTHINPQHAKCAIMPLASHRRSYRFVCVAVCVCTWKCVTACVFHLTFFSHPWNKNIPVVPLTNSCLGLILRRSTGFLECCKYLHLCWATFAAVQEMTMS